MASADLLFNTDVELKASFDRDSLARHRDRRRGEEHHQPFITAGPSD